MIDLNKEKVIQFIKDNLVIESTMELNDSDDPGYYGDLTHVSTQVYNRFIILPDGTKKNLSEIDNYYLVPHADWIEVMVYHPDGSCEPFFVLHQEEIPSTNG